MANRGVFTLATIMMVLFFLASHFDNYFFPLHFLETVIYAVILLLLFYGIEEWAYVMGFLSPLLWMILTLLSGTLLAGLAGLARVVTLQPAENPKAVVAGLVFVAGLALMVVSARAFSHEVWGRPEARRVLAGASLAVVAYYAVVLLTWLRLVQPVG